MRFHTDHPVPSWFSSLNSPLPFLREMTRIFHQWGKYFSRCKSVVERVSLSPVLEAGWRCRQWSAYFPQTPGLDPVQRRLSLPPSPGKQQVVCQHLTNSCSTHLVPWPWFLQLLLWHPKFLVTWDNTPEHHSVCPEDPGQLPTAYCCPGRDRQLPGALDHWCWCLPSQGPKLRDLFTMATAEPGAETQR